MKQRGVKRLVEANDGFPAVALWPKRGKLNDRQDHMMLYEYSGYSS